MKTVVGLLGMVMLALQGCALEAVVDQPEPGDRFVLEVQGLDESRVQTALDAWREKSGGKINVVIGTENPDAVLRIGSASRYSRIGRWMTLTPEAAEWKTEAFTANMVGRMLGMQLHDGTEGVLTASPTDTIVESDIEQCRLVGWCD